MSIRQFRMSIKPEWGNMVRTHGRRIEKFLRSGDTSKTPWYGTEFYAVPGVDEYSLTSSEAQAAEALKATFDIDALRRPNVGVDFIYGNIGFEVKKMDWWEFSEKQKNIMRLLEATFVVVSNDKGARIEKVVK